MRLLQELKNEIYRKLNVETTAQVKALYPSYNLRRTSDWLDLRAELVASGVDTQSAETTESYGFPESETVLTGKTSELIEAFPTVSDGSTGENSDRASADAIENDLEPDLSDPEPIDGAAWADFVRRTNPQPKIAPATEETTGIEFQDEMVAAGEGYLTDDGEFASYNDNLYGNGEFDEIPSPDVPMAPVPLALWDFKPGYNLMAVLSPWAHYLQWLDRLLFIGSKSTNWGYKNA